MELSMKVGSWQYGKSKYRTVTFEEHTMQNLITGSDYRLVNQTVGFLISKVTNPRIIMQRKAFDECSEEIYIVARKTNFFSIANQTESVLKEEAYNIIKNFLPCASLCNYHWKGSGGNFVCGSFRLFTSLLSQIVNEE